MSYNDSMHLNYEYTAFVSADEIVQQVKTAGPGCLSLSNMTTTEPLRLVNDQITCISASGVKFPELDLSGLPALKELWFAGAATKISGHPQLSKLVVATRTHTQLGEYPQLTYAQLSTPEKVTVSWDAPCPVTINYGDVNNYEI